MASLITSNFTLPVEVANGIWKKAQGESTIAKLSGQTPQKFGTSNVMVLSTAPKAELVTESAEKSPVDTKYSNVTVTPHKLQVTMRCSNEVQWADADYQLGVLNDMMDNAGIALGRSLDLIGYHKINPLTGLQASSITSGITDTSNIVKLTPSKYDAAVESAVGLVIDNGYVPTGVALDPMLAYGLATERDENGRKIYPEMGFGLDVTSFDGMKAAVSNTVSGKEEMPDYWNIIGFVGQFDAIRWGVQREIAAHLVEYGDPDGLGDLQRLNQVAIRAEIVYGIGIIDTNAFAAITKE